ncbi:hypothetical protein KM043_011001 [Ampulex compressa]|nr:hypothetical protein KM043_011001 [Ampulex compressa]
MTSAASDDNGVAKLGPFLHIPSDKGRLTRSSSVRAGPPGGRSRIPVPGARLSSAEGRSTLSDDSRVLGDSPAAAGDIAGCQRLQGTSAPWASARPRHVIRLVST